MSAAVWTSGDIVALSKASSVTIRVPRALWVGTAGTANFVTPAGQTVTNFPLQAGLNPIKIRELSDGGTASDIWGLY